MTTIGKYIKALREAKNYSQRKLGYMSMVSNATINRIENDISLPEPETLKKLAKPLGVSYTSLLAAAGYLNEKKFVPSNIRLIREKNRMSYSQLAEDIKKVTGDDITKEVLENLEKGKDEYITDAYIDIIAKYEGMDPGFLFRENSPEDIKYAAKSFPYRDYMTDGQNLFHIKDNELRGWICNPANTDYLVFAKKLADLGIDPDFILNEFVNKIFKKRKK